MNNKLCVQELLKQYNGKTVLEIENLDFAEGCITAIIGPSGAGKSTLLSILNGIESPTKGKVLFNTCEFSLTKRYEIETVRQMAMVFQKPVLFNSTVWENIAYGLKLRKVSRQIIKERVEEAAKLIGLQDKLNQKAVTLSGGEAQRVAIARALVLNPKVLLFDEPTANLDPANVAYIEKLIIQAKEVYKTTIIIVTHNMFQAKRLADHIVFMLNGRVIESGNAVQLFNHPTDDRTTAFIEGKMIY